MTEETTGPEPVAGEDPAKAAPEAGAAGLPSTTLASIVAVSATILAATAVTMWAIIADPPGDTVGRAFLTVLLIGAASTAFVGVIRIGQRVAWWNPIVWLPTLMLVTASGLALIWIQVERAPWVDLFVDLPAFVGAGLLLVGTAAVVSSLEGWLRRVEHPFARIALGAGIVAVALAAVLVALGWTLHNLSWPDVYWRVVLAIAVLGIAATALSLTITAILRPTPPPAEPAIRPPAPPAPPAGAPYQPSPAPAPARGLPGWAIALIVVGAVFVGLPLLLVVSAIVAMLI